MWCEFSNDAPIQFVILGSATKNQSYPHTRTCDLGTPKTGVYPVKPCTVTSARAASKRFNTLFMVGN